MFWKTYTKLRQFFKVVAIPCSCDIRTFPSFKLTTLKPSDISSSKRESDKISSIPFLVLATAPATNGTGEFTISNIPSGTKQKISKFSNHQLKMKRKKEELTYWDKRRGPFIWL